MREKPIAEDSVIAFRRKRNEMRERHRAATSARRDQGVEVLKEVYQDIAARLPTPTRKVFLALAKNLKHHR